jgi:hypothetical protein
MDGWVPVEQLIGYGFGRSGVVMANEAHDGMLRCCRTRELGVRMVRAAHEVGVRRLAMEALPWPARDVQGPITRLPDPVGGYLAQPDMQALIGAALELGWTLWAYEITIELAEDVEPTDLLTPEFTNRREREQAANIARLLDERPGEPLFVWCGKGHAYKESSDNWTPMGWHVQQGTPVDPFVIDQTVTVEWEGGQDPRVAAILAGLDDVLTHSGGAAGTLVDQAPHPWSELTGVDAVVVARDNALT